jgi:hypothetical protein
VPIYFVLAGVGLVDVSFQTAYAVISWLCWVCCDLVAGASSRRSMIVPGTPD